MPHAEHAVVAEAQEPRVEPGLGTRVCVLRAYEGYCLDRRGSLGRGRREKVKTKPQVL